MPETQKPLILISPPGSEEARDIGYINVPKIFKDPPGELDEVYQYDDESVFLELPQESNFWVYGKYIEQKKAAFDLIVPLFPKMLKYAVPWIVCEYGLYCVTQNKPINLREFTEGTIRRRASDYEFVGQALFEKRWKKAETPIPYLRTVIKRIKDESDQIETGDLFGTDPTTLSLDEPMITGDAFVAAQNDKEETLYNVIGLKNLDIDKADLIDCLLNSCKASCLSDDATHLFIIQFLNVTTIADAARYLEYSKKKYETTRRELNRKKKELENQIRSHNLHFFQQNTNSD